jgi:hypothetical protein
VDPSLAYTSERVGLVNRNALRRSQPCAAGSHSDNAGKAAYAGRPISHILLTDNSRDGRIMTPDTFFYARNDTTCINLDTRF